jgi:SAM-dependent methyltransferase
LPGAEKLNFLDSNPQLFDYNAPVPFDAHYFYQHVWAFEKVKASGAAYHVDVGSLAYFVGILSSVTRVIHLDIRPLHADLEQLFSVRGDILRLPFQDNTVSSLSCLHVAEHIGLGRYSDSLDPGGTAKAAQELTRILRPGGSIYFSVPIGRPRVCFNAHRIHAPEQILDYFRVLTLIDFCAVADDGKFYHTVDSADFAEAEYACGLFHFSKNR